MTPRIQEVHLTVQPRRVREQGVRSLLRRRVLPVATLMVTSVLGIGACGMLAPTPTAQAPTVTVTPFEAVAATSTPRPPAIMLPTAYPTVTSTPIPQPTLTPTPACTDTEGMVVDDSYPGVHVAGQIPVLVYLPPCYNQGDLLYPVLYLLHGKPFDEHHWPSLGVVSEADDQIEQDGLAGFIMVMPRVPEPLFSSTDGGPGSYEAEMTDGLMPYIQSTYRVIDSPAARGIAGISRGGVWSLEIGLHRPDLFGTVIALSPALFVNKPRATYDPLYMAVHNLNFPPRMLLVAGTTDWARPDTVRLADLLASQPTQCEIQIEPGGHEAATWEEAMPAVIQFVVEGWPAAHKDG